MVSRESATTIAVLLPVALGQTYDYEVPDGLIAQPGQYVRVPLGSRELVGVVWGPGSGDIEHKRLKPINESLSLPPMSEQARRFIDRVAAYTCTPRGQVLRLALRAPGALEPPRQRLLFRRTKNLSTDLRLTPARSKVLDVGADEPRSIAALAALAGVSEAVVRGLVQAGALEPVPVASDAPFASPDPLHPGPALSVLQAEAARRLKAHVAGQKFASVLLDGVTGSGKTEVYFEAVAEALMQGKQALILLPEIALTSQFIARFEARFGVRPAQWHSDLSIRERARVWRGVAEGRVQVLVGARSALFVPFLDLGLIVVDEEHESAFKQEEGVTYHARDMAVLRASLESCPVILSSATPSLETIVNAEQGRYERLVLPERHGAAKLPDVHTIDMRVSPPDSGRWLSPRLVSEIAAALATGEQSLLFLNRRGYAPLTLCRHCGHRIECSSCSAWMVEHRFRKELLCHHCGATAPVPRACSHCGTEDSFVACGPGVERILEEASEVFPQARIAMLSSDSVQGPAAQQAVLSAMEAREIDILVGTQIVAKGHHFPWLTLVGVVDADLGLENGDLRAGERTFQLLHQVSGRAGRAQRPGRVFLQTYMPEHPVMQALVSGERDRFLAREAEMRQRLALPPYGKLVGVVLSSPSADLVQRAARALARRIPQADGVSVLGPAPAPLALLRGRTRLRFLVKATKAVNVQAYMGAWLGTLKLPGAVRVSVDIDPYSFL